MANTATSINLQVKKLKKRGMTLDLDEEKIKEVLLDIGYYRLGFYWYLSSFTRLLMEVD